MNENKTKNDDKTRRRMRVANKLMQHDNFWNHKLEIPKPILKEQLTELWLPDDEGSSRIWGGIHLEQKWVWTLKRKGGKWRTSIGGFCGTEGNHATWRRFQDKWGRSATLNQRFKDKNRWFWGEPRDLRENSLFHKTQICQQKCLTMAYILWAETPKGPTQLKVQ